MEFSESFLEMILIGLEPPPFWAEADATILILGKLIPDSIRVMISINTFRESGSVVFLSLVYKLRNSRI
jgi:hypothetical protein